MLTTLECYVTHHEGWKKLCHGCFKHCISAIVGTEMVPFKENLNFKAQGGSSFAPYLDTLSLRVALVSHGSHGINQ